MTDYTIGSLFSGIGGLELGLERAGVGRVVWQCEIDPFARRVLAKHWPDVTRFEDIRELGRTIDVPAVDVLCGGFPCQDISLAGKGAGLEGERSGLWFEYLRIIRQLRPRFVVLENVRGLAVRGLDTVLGGLADVGYDARWSELSSGAVGGAALRRRIFVVAYPGGSGGPGLVAGGSASAARSWRWAGEACRQVVSGTRLDQPFGDRGMSPILCRGVDGVSDRVDRLRCIGNAVDPRVSEVVGAFVVDLDKALRGVA